MVLYTKKEITKDRKVPQEKEQLQNCRNPERKRDYEKLFVSHKKERKRKIILRETATPKKKSKK